MSKTEVGTIVALIVATATDATGCDTAAEVGSGNLTTLATPRASVDFAYAPPSDSATKKVCAYAEDAAGNSEAALWTTAIAQGTRRTNAHSKRIEKHEASLDIYFTHFNWCRVHTSLKRTPAMAMGLADRPMSCEQLVEMAD